MGAFGLHYFRSATRSRRGALLACLLLSLFALQSAVTRAHFHFSVADGGPAVVVDLNDDAGRSKDPRPAHDESQCPLWHAGSICGSVVAATSTVMFVPPRVRLPVAADERLIFPERFASAWRSRAPPAV
jgi:hypothetical protein